MHWTRSELSALMAVVHIFNGISTPASGYFIDKLPPHHVITTAVLYLATCYALTAFIRQKWQMWVVYGIMTGIGFGAMNLNVVGAAIVKTMPVTRRGLAIGASTSGGAFGQVVLVPLFVAMEGKYGWRWCFIALAIMTAFAAFPCYLLLKQPVAPQTDAEAAAEAEKEQKLGIADKSGVAEQGHNGEYSVIPSDSAEFTQDATTTATATATATAPLAAAATLDDEQLQERRHSRAMTATASACQDFKHIGSEWRFYGLALAFFVCGMTTTGFLESHLVAYAVDVNYTKEIGAFAFSVLSACNGVAMVFAGWLSDMYNPYHLLAGIFFLRGLCYLMLAYVVPESTAFLWMFAVCFGIVDYSVVPPTIALCQKYFPLLVGSAMGILLLLHSLGAALGSALGGYIFDTLGSYFVALLGCFLLCLVIGCTMYYQTAHQSTRNKIVTAELSGASCGSDRAEAEA